MIQPISGLGALNSQPTLILSQSRGFMYLAMLLAAGGAIGYFATDSFTGAFIGAAVLTGGFMYMGARVLG